MPDSSSSSSSSSPSSASAALLVGAGVAAVAGLAAGVRVVCKNAGLLHKVDADPSRRLKVVITGSTRGLGAALAKQHALLGDAVCISGRGADDVSAAVEALRRLEKLPPSTKICGCACDVSKPGAAEALAEYAANEMRGLDLWINNAGRSNQRPHGEARRPITEMAEDDIVAIVNTNLVGTILGARAAIKKMAELGSPTGGVVVNVDGAGSRGEATGGSAPYGSSKAAIPQLTKSLAKDAATAVKQQSSAVCGCGGDHGHGHGESSSGGGGGGGPVSVHTVSPGMVTTQLLLGTDAPQETILSSGGSGGGGGGSGSGSGSDNPLPLPPNPNKRSLWVFNILAERPDTVAEWLVPRMRALVAKEPPKKSGSAVKAVKPEYIKFLTPVGGVYRFLTMSSRKNRLFDLSEVPRSSQ
jgi:NAD(P)-dependent dehydrogenase (short-subunit alcohol dehydrogenase family)